MERYVWASVDRFVNRADELAQLDAWWADPHADPLAMLGRRRVGKSWLLRRFVHGRPGLVLVAERLAEGMQLDRFAQQLELLVGAVPRLNDVADLFTLLFRLGRDEPITIVVDEFPYLLRSTAAETTRELSRLQAVFEEARPSSQTRLILSGSTVSQMESLFTVRNPMHGRLRRFELRPLAFAESTPFLAGLTPVQRFERFAICGGVPRYLALLGDGPLPATLAANVLGPNTPLWNEGRSIVDQELREPATYFGILELLASGDKEMNELAQALRVEPSLVAKYLATLTTLRLVTRLLPVGAPTTSRQGNWHLNDPFLRFWFRFVFPFQADLDSGLPADALFDAEISSQLNDHTSREFERWCREWVRREGLATTVGGWWGLALNSLRRSGQRSSEEIDVVGLRRSQVAVVGEAKWTAKMMGIEVLDDLLRYKLPALEQAGIKSAPDLSIVLFSRSGYDKRLQVAASSDRRVRLVDVVGALSGDVTDA